MPHDVSIHEQRDRAESFGAVADDYDRYRPDYPDELIDDLVAARPTTVLDVGCGTGKAARMLAARGPSVLGVEIDPNMAAVAGTHGIEVEVSSFEQWDARGRSFDLVTCAQAWHWIDPVRAAPKLAGLLNPGGTAALFWNFEDVDPQSRAAVRTVYRRLAPELLEEPQNKPGLHLDGLVATHAFRTVEARTYRWDRALGVEDWVGMLGTHSDHLLLGPRRLAEVQGALRSALAGGEVRLAGGTYSIWARA
jgi:SAM-dependent methyltransferase